MYSLDINFLKDRNLADAGKTVTQVKPEGPTIEEQLPILIGAGVMILLIALPFGASFFLNWQTKTTRQNIDQLKTELDKLNADNKKLSEIQENINTIDGQIQSLVSVFNQIKPWSALLQELRNQIPKGVQVTSLQQADKQVTIQGYALSYQDVNDFLLTLQRSPFINAAKTKITAASMADVPINITNTDSLEAQNITVTFPKGVQYTIVAELSDLPASQLLPALARNGAVGLVSRIQILEQKGVFKP